MMKVNKYIKFYIYLLYNIIETKNLGDGRHQRNKNMTTETIIKSMEDCIIERQIMSRQLEDLHRKAADYYINGTYLENSAISVLINRVQEIIWNLDKKITNYKAKLVLDTDVKCKIYNRYIDFCEKYL